MESNTNLVLDRVAAGEQLLKATSSPVLKFVHRATVTRWILKGKIPCIRVGKSFLTVNSLIIEALGRLDDLKNGPKAEIETTNRAHLDAVESLKRRGVIKTAKPFKA